jgi:signal peptidase I
MTQDSPLPTTTDAQPPKKQENVWVETLKTLGLSLILAFGTRQFVADARFIPSGSMEPTLQVDDRVMVDKVSYRFSQPQRGDIVVFDPTDSLKAQGYNESFIKRVIGLPGDKVVVRNDKVTINGQPLVENYPSAENVDKMTQIYATKHSQNPDARLWQATDKGPDYQGVVPAGHYLVLGDHRSDSSDGRMWGFLPQKNIIGKAVVRYWPLNRMGSIDPKPSYAK